MEISVGSGSGAKVIRSQEHPVIDDQFCGKLTVLPDNSVVAQGFTHNIGHVHSKFQETYLVLEGELKMALHDPSTNRITEVELKALDAVRIPAGIGHKVLAGSSDNRILVSCEPHFVAGDEVRSTALEEKYGRVNLHSDSALPKIDQQEVHRMAYAKVLIQEFTRYLEDVWRQGPSYYSKSIDDNFPVYSFGEYEFKGQQLAWRIDKAIDSMEAGKTVAAAELNRECKSYFVDFLQDLKEGKFVTTGRTRSDDQVVIKGVLRPKSEVSAELAERILAKFNTKIGQLLD